MYYVHWVKHPSPAWAICRHDDGEASAVDYYRAEPSALHAVSLLNRGLARVEPHRPRGCRIQPVREGLMPGLA